MGHQPEVVRGSAIYIDNVLLEGAENISLAGQTAQILEATPLNSKVRIYGTDIPNAGNATFGLIYNPTNSVHQKLKSSLETGKDISVKVTIRGELKNSLKGTSAVEVGEMKAASVTAQGVLTFTEGESLVQEGDYLKPSSGDTLIVTGFNYSGSSITATVKKDGAGAITAVTASKTYDIERPAVQQSFTGKVTTFGTDGSSGVYRVPCSIQVNSSVTDTIGTPDI